MITVIVAGGSGTRLWPLSTGDHPKHLLQLIGGRTMLQSTYDRASLSGETVYILTEASHADIAMEQVPELDPDHFIVEPGRRGTANCILMAIDYISRRHASDEPIAFIHADHHIRDTEEFRRSLSKAASISADRRTLTLIGIEPTSAATGFGYIERGAPLEGVSGVYHVRSFKEKPDYDTAARYVESGEYLWNCGYFVGSSDVFLKTMRVSASDLYASFELLHTITNTDNQEYRDAYLQLVNAVIDTALIEKAVGLSVVSASFDWMDIGSFKDLHEATLSDQDGNYASGESIYIDEVQNSYVRNEEAKPVVVIGLDNIVVVNTSNGILVARTDRSQRVKEAVGRIREKENS